MSDFVNRDALIIFPKQALTDWVDSIFPDNKTGHPKFYGNDKGRVYLIPETDNSEEAVRLVRENFKMFFEEELFEWCVDEESWPQKLTWKMFEEWFHYSIQSMVSDVTDGPILKDED